MAKYIPFDPAAIPQTGRVTLGGIQYDLTLTYNPEADRYFFEFAEADGAVLCNGPLLLNVSLFWHLPRSRRPPVDLIPTCTDEVATVCNLETFGKTVFILLNE